MNLHDKKRVIAKIESDIAQVKKDIVILDHNSKPVEVGCCMDMIARSDLQVESEKNINIINDMSIRLQKLIAVLKEAKENNDFGICQDCGDDIAIERVMVIPESKVCIECATLG